MEVESAGATTTVKLTCCDGILLKGRVYQTKVRVRVLRNDGAVVVNENEIGALTSNQPTPKNSISCEFTHPQAPGNYKMRVTVGATKLTKRIKWM